MYQPVKIISRRKKTDIVGGFVNYVYKYRKITDNDGIMSPNLNVIKAKLETVPKLIGLGLTIEQIAQALDLDIQLILDSLKSE